MANLNELRGKDTEVFISETIAGLKEVRRLAQETVKSLRDMERELYERDSDE